MKIKPNNPKFAKQQKGRAFNKVAGKIRSLTQISFGSYCLQAISAFRISSVQLERIQLSVNKLLKRVGRFQILVFPHTPLTKKPTAIRMGKGKGAVNSWVARVHSGTIICELTTPLQPVALRALYKAQLKLPGKTRIIKKIL